MSEIRDLIIIGAGDFAREVAWVIERINEECPQWNFLGYVDDSKAGRIVDGYPVLGSVEWLSKYEEDIYVTCAIGSGSVRKGIYQKIRANRKIKLATIVDPSVIVGKNSIIGEGSIICAGSILAISSQVGINCIVNFSCTIGHDAVLEDFCTLNPSVNISGRVHICERTDIGTGTQIIQGKNIAAGTTIGAGAVVVKDIKEPGTYVGVPAKKMEKYLSCTHS